MIRSLLIANRGEIACRIIRTARRLAVRTVAVYSEADADAPHVRFADEAVAIGPPPARESYLVAERLLDAARRTGAQAIHPGYGFLSENAEFAEAVFGAGLTWVGAPPSAIRAMGRKDAAKRLMAEAGVPTTPGYLGEDQSPERLRAEASAVGYPVLIKAVAGGGGKGMRRVEQDADFLEELASCRREAGAAFGDDRVLIEAYVAAPRHIEVQVFGDTHGDVVHLFERDCSLQRRHQKVIEEAPAPGLDKQTRADICAAAVTAARAVNYVGAGTVEFIADASAGVRAERTWFMEMNTRLQVEHPVTEAITGQDLVEWQLRVASGEPLPLRQHELAVDGWAMEARLYAENPSNGFLPSTGRLRRFRLPSDIRADSGVAEAGEITPFYDPLIAKLVVHGRDRRDAAERLARACAAVEVWPVQTNAAFLARAAADPEFVEGRVDTGFIARGLDRLVPPAEPSGEVLQAAAQALTPTPGPGPWSALAGFRTNSPRQLKVSVEVGEVVRLVELNEAPATLAPVQVQGDRVLFDRGQAWRFGEPRPRSSGGPSSGDGVLRSPMPGRVVAVAVEVGQEVAQGQVLVILEAMKMELRLVAEFDGVVEELAALTGDQVAEGALLGRVVETPK